MVLNSLIGQKFGDLEVIARGENSKSGKARWVCKCKCGKIKEKPVLGYDLINGKVKSCGCLYYESNKGRNRQHGLTKTRIWNIWAGMIQRCKPARTNHKNYYFKGISVCKDWHDFQKFYNWAINNGYNENLTIDRINNSLGYFPENCRWVDYKTQERNRTNNTRLTVNGVTKTLAEWSEETGINGATISWRNKHNWKETEMFIEPNYANKHRRNNNGT